ncbi:MAG TPA: VCBS repeat-containing protein [Thermoanaerobaculia bacterium]|nr:VCBS repeat-containing protein [Thermoanaerobaculia bacterium]
MQITTALLFALACNPTLDAPRAYPLPGIASLTAIDVDADGFPDVASSHHSGVTVAYGRGKSLGPAVPIMEAGATWFLADVDADGRPDLIATPHGQPTALSRNLGGRRFGEPEAIASSGQVQAVADFTGDGHPDILIPRGELPALLAVNDGRGHFILRETVPITRAISIAGGVDGDGDLDLLHDDDTRILITRGDGKGGFAPRETRTFGSVAHAGLADLDRDGAAELLVSLAGWGQIHVFEEVTRQTATVHNAGVPRSITPADFNGDGAIDVAVLTETDQFPDAALTSSPRLMIFLNDGSGRLTKSDEVLIGLWQVYSPAGYVDAADFNLDGAIDLVVPAGESSVSIVFGRGDGTFDSPDVLQRRRFEYLAEAADLDGNGIDELITRTVGSGAETYHSRLAVGWLQADGTYAFEPFPSQQLAWHETHVFDVREGSIAEVTAGRLIAYTHAPRNITFVVGNARALAIGTDRFYTVISESNRALLRVFDTSGVVRFTHDLGAAFDGFAIRAADVTADGIEDLVVVRYGSSAPIPHIPDPSDGWLALLTGRADGTFDEPRRLRDATRPGKPFLGDFDGDGDTDIVADQTLLANHGRGQFAETELPLWATGATDVNGDGITDLLMDTTLWLGTRTGVFVNRGSHLLGSNLQGVVVARRRIDALPSLVTIVDYAGELVAADYECAATRRRTARP